MKTSEMKESSRLSPFELKDMLIKAASAEKERPLLNAGRGNPNFLATIPRHGFFQMGLFAMAEAERSFCFMPEGVGGFPQREGIEARFDIFVSNNISTIGVQFIRAAVSFVRDQLGLNAGDFIYEMCEGILGCMYPVPDRMLPLTEEIVGQYLHKEMVGKAPFKGKVDMFAVEGGTAAMSYIFNSLRENQILFPGDTIALGTPIFTPYIEMPELKDFRLHTVQIKADPDNGWQFGKSELDKLLNPSVKAFFLVNPSNPPAVQMSAENLEYLAGIVAARPDLLIITDDVYATFADDFTSIFAVCPHNTILVYSFSKYFGSTGWRLGVIAMHEDNVVDRLIAAHTPVRKSELDERYLSISTRPHSLKFIDRVVADSRNVALNHTAGLGTPSQVQMVMFSLFALMDRADTFKQAMKRLVRQRKEALYRDLGPTPPHNPNSVDYYHLLDMVEISRQMYGQEFSEWLAERMEHNELLFTLAEREGIVLLPGLGFGMGHPSARVSLANLMDVQYTKIGQAVRQVLQDYYDEFAGKKEEGDSCSK